MARDSTGDGEGRVSGMPESFFLAQRRHRRRARWYTAAATVAAVLQGIPASIMLAPALVATAVLGTDLVNLAVPAPDLFADMVAASRGRPSEVSWPAYLVGAPAAALLVILLIWWGTLRFFLRTGLGGVLREVGGRPPGDDLEERRLVNVVAETALAAGVATPAVLVLDAPVATAGVFGTGPDEATVVVTRRLLDERDRRETQGVAAHLVASSANGDLGIANTILALFVTQALVPAVLLWPVSRVARGQLAAAWRAVRRRSDPVAEARAVRALLSPEDDGGVVSALVFISWRLMHWVTTLFFVGPLLVLPWRARRLLADATAVQLTRDPDGLGHALAALRTQAAPLPGAEYASLYLVVEPAAGPAESPSLGLDVGLSESLHPDMDGRLRRLQRLGFRYAPPPPPARPRPRVDLRSVRGVLLTIAVSPLVALLVALLVVLCVLIVLCLLTLVMACVLVAVLFAGILLTLVVVPLHSLLRGLA